ncbi:MAG: GNAT family N-acetyltransferase [Planctomycetota bacterium]
MKNTEPGLLPQVRPAKLDDYDQIATVWSTGGTHFRAEGRDSYESFANQLQAFPSSYLVAVDEDRVVGVVLGTHDYRKGWINRLAVDPRVRRRGVAEALVAACETALHDQGMKIITAHVEPNNQASLGLFKKLGYLCDVPVVYLRKLTDPNA